MTWLRRALSHGLYLALFWAIYAGVTVFRILAALFRVDVLGRAWRRRRGGPPRVLFLACFFPGSAGFEQRVRKWAERLRARGWDARWRYPLEEASFTHLLQNGRVIRFQLTFFVRRLWQCLDAWTSDAVVVERELLVYNDYGSDFLDRFLLSLNRHVVLDYDDDIGAAKQEPRALSTFARLMLETGHKFHQMLSLYPAFIAGSPYLAQLVTPRPGVPAARISVVPTCIDLEHYGVKSYDGASPLLSFGWIGGVTNLGLLEAVLPALNRLAGERPCRLVVISGRAFASKGPLEVVNLRWSPETEAEDLLKIDIGLMPLDDSAVSRGKCGFKLLQYMASGIVSLASAVTVNRDIVTDGVDGFLVEAGGDWESTIRRVIARRDRFAEIGRKARERVAEAYTFEVHLDTYAAFLREVAERGPSG